ncbi:MAG: hypothetical protein ACM3TN_13765 [Alphaproteobacteria bacterium]
MAHARRKSTAGKILENILFLAEAFGDKAAGDIPKVPIIELAKCFELPHPRLRKLSKHRRKEWPLWK